MRILSFLRENKRIALAIFLTALAVRIVVCIPVFMDFERATGPGSDAKNYLVLANHLFQKQQFSVYEQETGYREAARTPGYPLFIALALLISGGRSWSVIVLQCIFEALLALSIFAFAGTLLKNALPAFWGAMLYGIHPHQSLYTSQVLSEILFTFVLFLSVCAIISYIHKKRKYSVLIAGGLLGIATLIRPIAFFFCLPLAIFILIIGRKRVREAIGMAFSFLAIFLLILLPWYVRNYLVFDRIMLSAIGNWNIGYYNGAMVIAQRNGISLREAQQQVAEEVKRRFAIPDEAYRYASDNPEICAQIASYGYEIIRQNPGTYSALHLAGFLHIFVPMEYAFLFKLFGRHGVEKISETRAISKEIISNTFRGRFATIFRKVIEERFKKFPWWFTSVWFAFSLFQLLVYVFAVRGFACFWRQQRVFFLLFLLTVIYFTIMPGPVGDPRFRVPVEPIFAFLAGVGIWRLKAKWAQRAVRCN